VDEYVMLPVLEADTLGTDESMTSP